MARTSENVLLKVLKVFAYAGTVTYTKLAEDVGVNKTTVRYHLNALISEGLVEQVEYTGKYFGRPPRAYRLSETFREALINASGTPGQDFRTNT